MTVTERGAYRRRSARILALWVIALAAATALMLPFRDRLDKAHVALLLLLIPLGGSAAGGRAVGLSLATASFLVFNWFFLAPYHTLVVADPLDWLVLAAFLTTSTVAAQLLYAAQKKTRIAQARAAEIDRLRVVGAEALHAGRAEDALETVAGVIREAAHADSCELLATLDGGALRTVAAAGAARREPAVDDFQTADEVASGNVAAVEHPLGTVLLRHDRPRPDELTTLASGTMQGLLLPLSVRERVVGVLRLRAERGLQLDAERWRFV